MYFLGIFSCHFLKKMPYFWVFPIFKKLKKQFGHLWTACHHFQGTLQVVKNIQKKFHDILPHPVGSRPLFLSPIFADLSIFLPEKSLFQVCFFQTSNEPISMFLVSIMGFLGSTNSLVHFLTVCARARASFQITLGTSCISKYM